MTDWTYGAEHELADWDTRQKIPGAWTRDTKDITIVNKTGIANDPTGKLHPYGGEICSPPTNTIKEQCTLLSHVPVLFPGAMINYRSNLHLHVRVPGLRKDLNALKQVQNFIHVHMPIFLPMIDPLPKPTLEDRPYGCTENPVEWLKGAQKRHLRNKGSHWTLLKKDRLLHQLEAPTISEFFDREPATDKNGKPLYHLQTRLCVNVRQLKETDTIEFRHWFGTLNPMKLQNAFEWCHLFLKVALAEAPFFELYQMAEYIENTHGTLHNYVPGRPRYSHWHERRYLATKYGNPNRAENIQRILEGTFE